MPLYIENLLRDQELLTLRIEAQAKIADNGQGMESLNIARCLTCGRPTVLNEHEYTPQLSFSLSDNEPEHEGTWYTCDWCGFEVEPGESTGPRKPAGHAGESDEDWARRVA
jgi:hypothetical protein